MSKRFAVISSTGASVVNAVFNNTKRSNFNIDLVIVDRDCGALDFAKKNKIKYAIAVGATGEEISSEINKILDENKIDYVYLFYTRLLKGKLLDNYSARIINFHPSLLPACPGLTGFEDSISSGALLVGSTVHFIDAGMDTGKKIQQTFTAVSDKNVVQLRHCIFAQQCASLHFLHKKLMSSEEFFPIAEELSLSQGFIPNIDSDSMELYKKLLTDVP